MTKHTGTWRRRDGLHSLGRRVPLGGSLSPVSGVGTTQVQQAVKRFFFYLSVTHSVARQDGRARGSPGAGQVPWKQDSH